MACESLKRFLDAVALVKYWLAQNEADTTLIKFMNDIYKILILHKSYQLHKPDWKISKALKIFKIYLTKGYIFARFLKL